MARLVMWVSIYLMCFGLFSVRVKYVDGHVIYITGWPDALFFSRGE